MWTSIHLGAPPTWSLRDLVEPRADRALLMTNRHKKYANVFGLGDASNLPTSKTAAAVSSQAAVATANLLASIRDPNAALPESYSGYTSCPLVTGYGASPLPPAGVQAKCESCSHTCTLRVRCAQASWCSPSLTTPYSPAKRYHYAYTHTRTQCSGIACFVER
jgi:hypothetical protein